MRRRLSRLGWSCFCGFLLQCVLLSGKAARVDGRSILLNGGDDAASAMLIHESQFPIGSVLQDPATLRMNTLDDLVGRVAGKPSLKAYATWGNFDEYWPSARINFEGKTHEALIAWQENTRFKATGDGRRIIVTAAEGGNTDAADLLLRDADGRILTQFQCKLGSDAAMKALKDSKYNGMTILTSDESLCNIKLGLLKTEMNATRRGIQVPEDWAAVRSAIESGRLASELPSHASLILRSDVEVTAKSVVSRAWEIAGDTVDAVDTPVDVTIAAMNAVNRIPANAAIAKAAGPILIVVDYAANIYLVYVDYGRFRNGDIGGVYFTFKTSLHAAQMAFTTAAIVDPEPTTKVVCAVTAIVLAVIDVASDPIYAATKARTEELYRTLERDERYYYCRQQLINEMDNAPLPRLPSPATTW